MDVNDVKILNKHALKFEKNLEKREIVSILAQVDVLNDGHQYNIGV